jgi:Bacterial archaeo-eukaryotic release factor family 2
VRRADIAELFQADGPFVSAYLATPRRSPNAAQQLAVRWKDARRELADAGAPDGVLEAVDPLIDGAVDPLIDGTEPHGDTLAVVAGAAGVLLAEQLPAPPPRETVARYGPLPDVAQLVAHVQGQPPPWLAVRVDRTGAQVAVLVADAEPAAVQQVEGETGPHIRKSKPGGWSQRRYQEHAEHHWQATAKEVADRLAHLVDQLAPRLVAVAGDVRAVQLLREAAPDRVAALLREVGGELADLDQVLAAGRPLAAELARARNQTVLARFAAERGQRDRAVEGVPATAAALAEARVETLLLVPEAVEGRTAWFGPAPFQLATEPEALGPVGVDDPVQARLADVLLRAVFGGGGEARLVAGNRPERPAEGVGGLVRWRKP